MLTDTTQREPHSEPDRPATLGGLLSRAASKNPHGVALVETATGRHIRYQELNQQAIRLANQFQRWKVGPGSLVGLWLPKSIESVATIHATLKTGAAHVPVDPLAPSARAATIFSLAGVSVAVVHVSFVEALKTAWPPELADAFPRLVVVGDKPEVDSSAEMSWVEIQNTSVDREPEAVVQPATDLAYILFTSGSTGQPKGVMLSHENAWCFLDWCEREIAPLDTDVFASHAPLHFDLSVFDLYMSVRHAAPLVLIDEQMAKDPSRLADYLKKSPITVWYSAPSILALMVDHGNLNENLESSGRPWAGPRITLFAGEVFPVAPLKVLRNLWSGSEFWNLYGPTETNVCTALHVPQNLNKLTSPLPIGPVCSPLQARVVDPHGEDVPAGQKGELVIAGSRVMSGYFGREDLTAAAFLKSADGLAWYRTGDLVVDDGSGNFIFHGRRDRMVKKRGYRIELGEIESALYRNDAVQRAAVLAIDSESQGLRITAFVAMKPDRPASIISMKRHCSVHLPQYMIPDEIKFLPDLPTTSTDKVDYPALRQILGLVA